MSQDKTIYIKGARVHNLKNVNVSIPHNTLTVITGLSGSGKSTLAFDTIFAEGQRRYVESLSAYARQFLGRINKPDVDLISGIAPLILKKTGLVTIIISTASAHIVGSVLIKSWGLAKWYLEGYDLGYWEFVLWRLVNYTMIGAAECVIIYLLYRNRGFKKQIEGMVRK